MTRDLTGAVWRTSTRSDGMNQCVEVADNLADVVAVRDSKDPHGPVLLFSPPGWASFVAGVKAGAFTLP